MDPDTIRAFDTNEITVDGVKTTTGAEAIKKFERIKAKEGVVSKQIESLKQDLAGLKALYTREKGVNLETGEAPAVMVPKYDAAGKKIPKLDANKQQIIGSDGRPKWQMTEKLDEDGEPIRKRAATVGVRR